MSDENSDEDSDRAEAVLRRALELTEHAFIPFEIIMLITLLVRRLDPKDAIVTAYLLGRCRGNIERLEREAKTEVRDE